MPTFKCKLGDAQGRIIEKELEADNASVLKVRLEKEGCLVYEVSRKRSVLSSFGRLIRPGKIKASEFLVFNQEMTVLLKAGVPLLSSLEVLAEKEENSYFKDILKRVSKDVKEGAPLSDAMEGASKVFTKLYVSSIRAGEKSGDITSNIRRYVTYSKGVEALKKKVINASIYPLILVTVAVGVVLFLLLYVVPSFSQVFLDSETPLPLPTLILVRITDIIKDNIIFLLIFVILTGILFYLGKRTPRFVQRLDHLKIQAPWLGKMNKKYSVAKFSRTLSAVLKSGEPLVPALALSAGTLDNTYLETKLILASTRVKEGEPLAKAIEETGLMPPTALKMVMVGESSGALADMFENIAELFEEDVDRSINMITSTIEPLMMLVMGLVIAFIVVAMYLPIFRIAGSMR